MVSKYPGESRNVLANGPGTPKTKRNFGSPELKTPGSSRKVNLSYSEEKLSSKSKSPVLTPRYDIIYDTYFVLVITMCSLQLLVKIYLTYLNTASEYTTYDIETKNLQYALLPSCLNLFKVCFTATRRICWLSH